MKISPVGGHRRVTVMGLGLFGGGVGAARFWATLGAHVTVTDLRDETVLAPSLAALEGLPIRYVLGRHETDDFARADAVVVNPAVHPDNPYLAIARQAGADIVTEVGLALRLLHGPILAVTGSNGKSTTTALLGAMLRGHDERVLVGGNIGGSVLDAIPTHAPSAPVVLELSSYQLQYLRKQRFAPRVAVVTNLSPNHLDWHRTTLNYYEAKRNLIRHQEPSQWALLNHEDQTLRAWGEEAPGAVLWTARDDPGTPDAAFLRPTAVAGEAEAEAGEIVVRLAGRETVVAPRAALRLPGAHNVLNAIQAAAAAFLYARRVEPIQAGLADFTGLPHRLEEVARAGSVRFINDSIATTPESAMRGLDSFDEPVVLIAGGSDKGTPFEELGAAIQRRAVAAVLVGTTAPQLRAAAEAAGAAGAAGMAGAATETPDASQASPSPATKRAGGSCRLIDAGMDFDAAVRLAYEACPRPGVVLLSPACASFDLFPNFQARGERFRVLARQFAATQEGAE